MIEDKTSSFQDRLYFLEQFTSGQAKDLVRSCMHMDPHKGYTKAIEAKQLLQLHFGDEIKIANAYLEKALNWTSIKPDDGTSLHAYALYLRECYNAMQNLSETGVYGLIKCCIKLEAAGVQSSIQDGGLWCMNVLRGTLDSDT